MTTTTMTSALLLTFLLAPGMEAYTLDSTGSVASTVSATGETTQLLRVHEEEEETLTNTQCKTICQRFQFSKLPADKFVGMTNPVPCSTRCDEVFPEQTNLLRVHEEEEAPEPEPTNLLRVHEEEEEAPSHAASAGAQPPQRLVRVHEEEEVEKKGEKKEKEQLVRVHDEGEEEKPAPRQRRVRVQEGGDKTQLVKKTTGKEEADPVLPGDLEEPEEGTKRKPEVKLVKKTTGKEDPELPDE